MGDFARKFTWATVPAFIVSILAEVLIVNAVIPVEATGLPTISRAFETPVVRVLGVTIFLAIPSYLIVSYIVDLGRWVIDRRRSIRGSNSPAVWVSDHPPSTVYWRGLVQKYGVNWVVEVGTPRRSSEPYAYIHGGPRCLECDTEMLYRTVPKWLVMKTKVWRCGDCGNTVERPSEVLYREKDSIENICEKELLFALNEGGEEYLDELENFGTIDWNPPRR